MKKEEMFFLELWNDLKNRVELNKQIITPLEIYQLCFEWAKKLKSAKDSKVRELYDMYLSYFEDYDIDSYQFGVRWYSLQDLINFDVIRPFSEKIENVVLRCRNILWEILVFKSDRPCKNCDDDLRVMIERKEKDVFFICDNCNYCENLSGKEVFIVNMDLSPVTPDVQEKLLLKPSSYV